MDFSISSTGIPRRYFVRGVLISNPCSGAGSGAGSGAIVGGADRMAGGALLQWRRVADILVDGWGEVSG